MKYTFIRQPIATDHGIVAYELLVRGVGADSLLPASDVLEWANDDITRWRKIDLDALEVAIALAVDGVPHHVNVSSATVGSWVYFARLGEALKDGVSAEFIHVEVSERLEPTEAAQTWLTCIRGMGFMVFLDDFGTHHSNNYALSKFRPSGLKIDGQLIRGVQDPYYRGIIQKDILFCRDYGLRCIAEHVENELILDGLKSICDRVGYKRLGYQGWLFGVGEPVGVEF